MTRLRWTLAFQHSLLIGGQSPAVLADAATARDPGGAPIIPASALKGALRIGFERLLEGLGEPVCHPSLPELACPTESPCLACQLFGSPGREGVLRFQDARLVEPARSLYTKRARSDAPERPTGFGYAIRPGVAISRSRRTAEEDLLFASEVVAPLPPPEDGSWPPLTFTTEIEVRGSISNEVLLWLQAAAESVQAIGADKSRGLGHLARTKLEAILVEESRRALSPTGTDLQVTLVPLEDVRISGVKVSNNFLETLPYVPGGTLRGAVAKTFATARGGWHDPAIREAFFTHPALFSSFYPTIGGRIPPRPIPLSARTCKHFPGFTYSSPSPRDPEERHGCKDILIGATLVKLLRQEGVSVVLDDRCNRCQAPLKPLEGFYYLAPMIPSLPRYPLQRVVTKTAINRSRFTSAEGQLYTYEAIDVELESPEEQSLRFLGTIRSLPDTLKQHLVPGQVLFLGGARSRGFGKVRVAQVEAEQREQFNTLRSRLDRFTGEIQQALRAVGHPKANFLFFALTLTSDLLLPPGAGLAWLQEEMTKAVGFQELRIEKAIVRTGYRGGFNEAIGVPKTLLPALVMGSAMVFSCPSDKEEVKDQIVKAISPLLRTGLGLRREEGFGLMSFCDPFHLERREQG